MTTPGPEPNHAPAFEAPLERPRLDAPDRPALSTSSRGRREFLKVVSLAAAYSRLRGNYWSTMIAAEIQPLSTGTPGTLTVRLPEFPALLEPSGSVRFAINPLRGNASSSITPNGQFYPVIVNRGEDDTFYALSSRCTHEGCVVDALEPTSNLMICPCHGSIYSIDGRRISGRATGPLPTLPFTFNGVDTLRIQVPGLGYSVRATALPPTEGGDSRIQLSFSTSRNVSYEVHFRENLDAAASPIPFALTETDPITQTVFTPTRNANTSLYVERKHATGFYTVAVRVTSV